MGGRWQLSYLCVNQFYPDDFSRSYRGPANCGIKPIDWVQDIFHRYMGLESAIRIISYQAV